DRASAGRVGSGWRRGDDTGDESWVSAADHQLRRSRPGMRSQLYRQLQYRSSHRTGALQLHRVWFEELGFGGRARGAVMIRSTDLEMMDVPGKPADLQTGNLRDLRTLNRYLGCRRNALTGLARLVEAQRLRRFTLLDIGTGSGDIPAAIARWARQRKIAARISALERDRVAFAQAVDHTRGFAEITVLRGDGRAPPFQAGTFDFLLASQL